MSQVLMLYLPKKPRCWTHNRIIDHGECLELKVKEQSQALFSFFRAFMTNFAWTVSSLRIQGAFTTLHHQSHTTPTQSLTWVFSVVRWGYSGCIFALVAFSDIFYTGDKFYTMSPLVRDLVSSLPTHWGLPRPQQYVLHLTWLVTGH